MGASLRVREGSIIPWWLAPAWYDPLRGEIVCYPLGVHLVVRYVRAAWIFVRTLGWYRKDRLAEAILARQTEWREAERAKIRGQVERHLLRQHSQIVESNARLRRKAEAYDRMMEAFNRILDGESYVDVLSELEEGTDAEH